MRWRVAVFGTLGGLATVVAAGFVVAPDLLLSVPAVARAVEGLSGTDPELAMLVATLVVGLYVALAARSSASERTFTPVSDAQRRFDRAVADPPEAVTADRRALTAADLDAAVDGAVAAGGDQLRAVRDLLDDLAAQTYAETYHVTPEEAQAAVAGGTWTDDRVAAAFLGGADGPDAALLSRIRLWLTPERERERRIERTLTALETLVEAEP
jgi:hypothetical protein